MKKDKFDLNQNRATYKSIWVKDVESCMIQKFFQEEQKKPIDERQSFCHISCPCENCTPGRLVTYNLF